VTVALIHCDLADREHAEHRRQYSHTFHYPRTICVAESFWTLPIRYRDGIISHELGHLLAGPEASEYEADLAWEERTGIPIEYVNSRYGFMLESLAGSVRRPRVEFDSVSGRGSAGLPVALNPRKMRCCSQC
jgi:hypothetical protein